MGRSAGRTPDEAGVTTGCTSSRLEHGYVLAEVPVLLEDVPLVEAWFLRAPKPIDILFDEQNDCGTPEVSEDGVHPYLYRIGEEDVRRLEPNVPKDHSPPVLCGIYSLGWFSVFGRD